MIRSTNAKRSRMCAFCKHWYDPTNSAINPKSPMVGLWEYDHSARKKCLIRNLDMSSWASCSKHECKV